MTNCILSAFQYTQAQASRLLPFGVDAASVSIVKVEMYGKQAGNAFGNSNRTIIQLKQGVEYWVNASITDFVNAVIKP